ncbi:hypothetical protein ACH5RR_013444 [Cinchona calisaya]|uniref:Uncharacterized protein n=1 Tax=Cinchona calisaya TaxID=153742 RepID=A0ABD3A059_9GENT
MNVSQFPVQIVPGKDQMPTIVDVGPSYLMVEEPRSSWDNIVKQQGCMHEVIDVVISEVHKVEVVFDVANEEELLVEKAIQQGNSTKHVERGPILQYGSSGHSFAAQTAKEDSLQPEINLLVIDVVVNEVHKVEVVPDVANREELLDAEVLEQGNSIEHVERGPIQQYGTSRHSFAVLIEVLSSKINQESDGYSLVTKISSSFTKVFKFTMTIQNNDGVRIEESAKAKEVVFSFTRTYLVRLVPSPVSKNVC